MFTVSKGSRADDWEVSVAIDESKLSADIREKLFLHGLKQKIADAASAAKTPEDAEASMQKAVDALLAGDWSSRGAAIGVDEFTREARKLVRAAMKDRFGAKSPAWATFTGLSDDEQNAKLDANFAKNEATLRPIVEKRLAAKREKVAVEFDI